MWLPLYITVVAVLFAAISMFGVGFAAIGLAIMAFLASVRSTKGISNVIKAMSLGIVNCFN